MTTVYVCHATNVRTATIIDEARHSVHVRYAGRKRPGAVPRVLVFDDAETARRCREIALRYQQRHRFARTPPCWEEAVRVAIETVSKRRAA
jgi:hypothetical protein